MEELERRLVAIFNASTLPLEAKRYVVLAFSRNVEDAWNKAKEEVYANHTGRTEESEIQDLA